MVVHNSVGNRRADRFGLSRTTCPAALPDGSRLRSRQADHAFGRGWVGDPCRPSRDTRFPARRPTAVPEDYRSSIARRRPQAGVESGGLARRFRMKAPRRRAASVESLKRTHRSSMPPGSNGFPYHLTTSLFFSWSASSAALRNCMKPGTPPTSAGAHRRSPWTNAAYSKSASPSRTDSRKMSCLQSSPKSQA